MKAQVSLEYLLVLLAFFGAFALLLPFYSAAFSAGIFALDSMNAKRFSESIQDSVSKLIVLGNGSSIQISADPSLEWKIFSEKNELFIALESNGVQKSFSVSFPNEINFSETVFSSEKGFLIKKDNGKILFENSD